MNTQISSRFFDCHFLFLRGHKTKRAGFFHVDVSLPLQDKDILGPVYNQGPILQLHKRQQVQQKNTYISWIDALNP